jgi:formylglycine-generating enzyme required for sulfatase activity
MYLSTETEREKAARGSSETRVLPNGNGNPSCTLLNYKQNDGSTKDYCVGDTSQVGSYPSGEVSIVL